MPSKNGWHTTYHALPPGFERALRWVVDHRPEGMPPQEAIGLLLEAYHNAAALERLWAEWGREPFPDESPADGGRR